MTFNGNKCGFEDKDAIKKAGDLLGIRSAVDAYGNWHGKAQVL